MPCGSQESVDSDALPQSTVSTIEPGAFPDVAQRATAMNQSRILIVDDQRVVTQSLATLFQREGLETIVSHTGAEALRQCAKHAVVAAIIDIHLPDMNGLVLAARLRAILAAHQPIIVMSGDTSMENLNTLHHVGAAHFFSKPFKVSQLLARVKELLASPGASQAPSASSAESGAA